MTGEIKVGDRFRDPNDGEVVEIVSVSDGNITRIRGVRGPGGDPYGSVPWNAGQAAFREFYSERAPTAPPPASSEPAEDHKPRGVKPPLALIPWEVVPDAWAPAVVRETLDPARVIAVLLETQGDALIDDVARAFSHGAAKYGIDNWREIAWTPQASLEYRSAMLRHLYADAIGEALDPDSGVSHLAHACASAMIHTWHETRDARAEGAQ